VAHVPRHMKDSLWSCDLFRCESATLRTHWVLVVMDPFTPRMVGFGVQGGIFDGPVLCRMFNRAIRGQRRSMSEPTTIPGIDSISGRTTSEVSETASEQRGDRAVAVLLGSPTSSAPTYFGPWGRGKLPAWLLKLAGRRIYGETPGAYRGTSLRL